MPTSSITEKRSAGSSPADPSDFSILVAGGGVGGLEAILALRELSDEVRIELLSPAEEFHLTPLSVAEPFGAGPAPSLATDRFCADLDVHWTRGELAEIWSERRRVLTDSGDELFFDGLVLAIGARRHAAVPDALTFRGAGEAAKLEQLLEKLAARGEGRLAFVVPPGPSWPLPIYELAMLATDRLLDTEVEILLSTPERAPLEAIGSSGSERAAELLEEAGIELRLEAGGLAEGETLGADYVVALPTLDVPEIPGLNQASHGFIPIDPLMRVEGLERVWAVGDATWFPHKQGGIATQQADVAAADVASVAGVAVEVPSFAPVMRVALLTPDGPYYLRSGDPDSAGEQRAPLWWPPSKVAGRLLAPYLARQVDPDLRDQELIDREVDSARDADHEEALGLALVGADLDARAGELRRALHWLEIAEGLNLVVPEEYREKRRRWQRQLAGEEPSE